MQDTKTSADQLLAGEKLLETAIANLGTAVSKEIADFAAQQATKLQAAGVDQTVVDSVTADFAALTGKVTAMTSQISAADPGAAATPAPTAAAPDSASAGS